MNQNFRNHESGRSDSMPELKHNIRIISINLFANTESTKSCFLDPAIINP